MIWEMIRSFIVLLIVVVGCSFGVICTIDSNASPTINGVGFGFSISAMLYAIFYLAERHEKHKYCIECRAVIKEGERVYDLIVRGSLAVRWCASCAAKTAQYLHSRYNTPPKA